MTRHGREDPAIRVLRIELQLVSGEADSWARNLASLGRQYSDSQRRSVTARIARYRAEANSLARAIAILEAAHA